MYWLRWHYHVKDIAGAPYKIKKKERKKEKTNKTTESPTVSSRGQTTVILCSTITLSESGLMRWVHLFVYLLVCLSPKCTNEIYSKTKQFRALSSHRAFRRSVPEISRTAQGRLAYKIQPDGQDYCVRRACEMQHVVSAAVRRRSLQTKATSYILLAVLCFLSASLYVSKSGAYWDRLCRDVVGRWLVGCHARALWPNGAS